MDGRSSGPVDSVVFGRGLALRLLPPGYFGFFCLDPLGAVEHHLDHCVLHERGEAKQQAGDEPDVDGFDVRHFRELGGEGRAFGGQRQH